MRRITRAHDRSLFSILLILSILSFAVPLASQDDASDEFILFSSDRAFPSLLGVCTRCEDIYVMSPAGELPGVPNAIRLTAGGGVELDSAAYTSLAPDWSRAKKLIAFHSNRPTDPDRPAERIPQIYLMNPDGTGQQLLVNLPGGAQFPAFSYNGNELCFHSRTMPRRDIYIVNVHGTGLTNLTSPTQSPGQTGVHGDNLRCDWSPKANAIAFVSTRHDPLNEEIYVMNADGSDVVRLTDATGSDTNPAWSPKGDRIAFESNRSGRPEIWVMNADGSDQARLTNFDADITPSNVNVTKATWSPKGDRIAFHRRVTPVAGMRGHLEVYTMNADGSDVPVRITFSEDPGSSGFPSWGKWGTD
jgi:Tol biopolymer transport system component